MAIGSLRELPLWSIALRKGVVGTFANSATMPATPPLQNKAEMR